MLCPYFLIPCKRFEGHGPAVTQRRRDPMNKAQHCRADASTPPLWPQKTGVRIDATRAQGFFPQRASEADQLAIDLRENRLARRVKVLTRRIDRSNLLC